VKSLYEGLFRSARVSIRRSPVLILMAVCAIGFGIGSAVTMSNILRSLTGDPIPAVSGALFHVQLDPRPVAGYLGQDAYRQGIEPPGQLTWGDAQVLLKKDPAIRKVAMTGGRVAVSFDEGRATAFYAAARYTTKDFFPMFLAPFLGGRPWSAAEDDSASNVVVLTKELANRVFSTLDVVGRTIRLTGKSFRIVGVLDSWSLQPRVYDLSQDGFREKEAIYIPLSTAVAENLEHAGSVDCWGGLGNTLVGSPCTWIQYWVEIDSVAGVQQYRQFISDYSMQQNSEGAFQRPPNIRLRDVREWMSISNIVPQSVKLQTLISIAFLGVCLVNVGALLFVMFQRRRREIGIRRAFGATVRRIFFGFIVEACGIGLAGGLFGIFLSAVASHFLKSLNDAYASTPDVEWHMLWAYVVAAVALTCLSSLWPALRACRVSPAEAIRGL
jgi:putative ABC transport system permease protein